MRIFGHHDDQTLRQFEHVRERAVDAALMADGHVGYVMPIGGVAAYDDQVSVVGVGFDIACGNAAIRTDLTLESLGRNPKRLARTIANIADEIASTVSFGIGRRNDADDAPVDHPLFSDPAWDAVPEQFRRGLVAKARALAMTAIRETFEEAGLQVRLVAVLTDCRRTFPHLIDIRGGTCTVKVWPAASRPGRSCASSSPARPARTSRPRCGSTRPSPWRRST